MGISQNPNRGHFRPKTCIPVISIEISIRIISPVRNMAYALKINAGLHQLGAFLNGRVNQLVGQLR